MTTGELVIGLGMLVATIALVVATIMLAIVTRQLSKSAKRQTRLIERQTEILKENQQRAMDRDQPKLMLRQHSHSVGRVTKDGHTDKLFDGFTIANAGAVDVTITGVAASFAVPVADPDASSMPSLELAPKERMGSASRATTSR